jgi:hypothetical protein
MTIDFPSTTNLHHVHHISPCVRLHVGGFLDLSGSEGRSAMAPMSRLHRLAPLCFFFSLTLPAATSRTLARVL